VNVKVCQGSEAEKLYLESLLGTLYQSQNKEPVEKKLLVIVSILVFPRKLYKEGSYQDLATKVFIKNCSYL
jgi:hypothetical protein